MKLRYIFLFIFFGAMGVTMVGLSFYGSGMLEKEPTTAGGFGVSPPIIYIDDLGPGESRVETVSVLRSDKGFEQGVSAWVYGENVKDWIKIQPKETLNFGVDSYQAYTQALITLPEDVKGGLYEAEIHFSTGGSNAGPGVGISLGAIAQIKIKVEGEEPMGAAVPAEPEFNPEFKEIFDENLYKRLAGMIVIEVENNGQAWYIAKAELKVYRLDTGAAAMQTLKAVSAEIGNEELIKIPLGVIQAGESDRDTDGLPDKLEIALGTDPNNYDTDKDSFSDYEEAVKGYSPLIYGGPRIMDEEVVNKFSGQVVDAKGEGEGVWYIEPGSKKRYYIGDEQDARQIIESFGLGISNQDAGRLME